MSLHIGATVRDLTLPPDCCRTLPVPLAGPAPRTARAFKCHCTGVWRTSQCAPVVHVPCPQLLVLPFPTPLLFPPHGLCGKCSECALRGAMLRMLLRGRSLHALASLLPHVMGQQVGICLFSKFLAPSTLRSAVSTSSTLLCTFYVSPCTLPSLCVTRWRVLHLIHTAFHLSPPCASLLP